MLCFVGGFALSSIGQNQDAANSWYRTWIANIPQSPDSSVGDNPYYQGTLRVLYLLLASGLMHP